MSYRGKCLVAVAVPLCLFVLGLGPKAQEKDPEPGIAQDPIVRSELLAARSQFWLTGDHSYAKSAVLDLAPSPDVSPPSLVWPIILHNYFVHSGDTQLVAERSADLRKLFRELGRYETSGGLIADEAGRLVQWPKSMQEKYDYEYARTRENAVVNAFYYEALRSGAELLGAVDEKNGLLNLKAARVRLAFERYLIDPDTGLVKDAPGSSHTSVFANAVAVCLGLIEGENAVPALELIREKGLECDNFTTPYLIEACFVAGDADLAYGFIGDAKRCRKRRSPSYLVGEYILGLSPTAPGWKSLRVAPNFPSELEQTSLVLKIPGGKITAAYERGTGLRLTVPPDVAVHVEADEGERIVIRTSLSHADGMLSAAQRSLLETAGWPDRVGAEPGVWVAADEQILRVIENGDVVFQARCATSKTGLGSEMDSLKTPLGWHSVATKLGSTAPWGQVFRAKQATSEIWKPGGDTVEDLVLTRVLALTGEEPGKNKGGSVDSFARHIYIHGTNDEDNIGTPSSHGCVRLKNDDVIEAFKMIPEHAMVLITSGDEAASS